MSTHTEREEWEPCFIDTEQRFTDFVGTFRAGTKVTALDESIPDGALNADFYFADGNVVAELKRLETDAANPETYAQRLVACFKHCGYSGDVLLDCIFRGKPVPRRVAQRLTSILSRPIFEAIKKANKQIGSTKDLINKPDAKGLILLANDRNLGFNPRQMLAIVCKAFPLLTPCHTDCVVYFAPNIYHDRGDGIAYSVWTPVYNIGSEHFAGFVNALGKAWGDFAEMLGDPYVTRETGGEELWAGIADAQPIAKFQKP